MTGSGSDSCSRLDLPIVTALRKQGPERVEVHLDGRRWRVVPLDAAVAARLAVGVGVDRGRARELNRALRRHRALTTAMRAVRWRDQTRATVERRLRDGGVGPTASRSALETLERVGVIDDTRVADARATTLAERGAGDAMIAADLIGRGIEPGLAVAVIARLPAESLRAAAVVERRGLSPATLRFLAARGFSEDTVDPFVAGVSEEGVG